MGAVTVLWVGIGAAAVRTGFALTGDLPLSRLAHESGGRMLFGPSLVVASVLFVIFCIEVRRRYPVGRGFTTLMVSAMAGQFVAGVIPIGTAGTSNPLHVAAGLLLGAAIPLFLWRFAAGQQPGRWRLTAYTLFLAEAVASVAGVALSQQGVAALAEVVPAVFFHLWVVVVTVHDRAAATEGTRLPPGRIEPIRRTADGRL